MRRSVGGLTVAFLSAVVLTPASAQVSVGVRGGLSFAHFGGDVKTDTRTRFLGGIFASFSIAENVGLQPELAYVQKGAQTESQIADPVTLEIRAIQQKTSLDNLELLVPVKLDIKVKNEKLRPRLYAGPSVGLLLNCERKTEESTGPTPAPVDCGEEFKDIDVGLLFGLGVDLGAGPGRLTADVRYDVGLTDISDVAGEPSMKNRALQILVGYVRDL